MKNFLIIFNIIGYFFVSLAVFSAMPVFASVFSFDVQNKNLFVGEQFKVDLNINTDKENINAVEGNIVFPTDYFDLSEIRSGDSVVNFWVDKPSNNDGTVSFSGITPGGYVLDKGLILSLIFTAKKEGNASIKIENASALKNDGNGTLSKISVSDLQIVVASSSQNLLEQNLKIIDKNPPEDFRPEVVQDPNLFGGKWVVIFLTQDKGSGISGYEVKESKYNIFDFSKWVYATSPFVLSDQELHSNIFIKATDNAGNERIVKLSPEKPIVWYANIENWFIIALVFVIVALVYFFLNKKGRRPNK
jgi:hypothetical protein